MESGFKSLYLLKTIKKSILWKYWAVSLKIKMEAC